MQNEERINGLENQVRTLKRIVYGFGCLLVAGVVVAAQTPDKTREDDQPLKIQLVGPITVKYVDRNDNHKIEAELEGIEKSLSRLAKRFEDTSGYQGGKNCIRVYNFGN